MRIRRGHLYVVDFNPRVKTKPGKIRPAVVVQDDVVNEAGYPSTIVLPTTTRLVDTETPLRLPAGTAGLERDSDVLDRKLRTVLGFAIADRRGCLVRPVAGATPKNARLRQAAIAP